MNLRNGTNYQITPVSESMSNEVQDFEAQIDSATTSKSANENMWLEEEKHPKDTLSKEGGYVLRLRRAKGWVAPRLAELCNKELFDHACSLLSCTRGKNKIAQPDDIISMNASARVNLRDYKTLAWHNWLNDQVIDYYLNMIFERSKANQNLPKVYCLSIFFYVSILSRGHAHVLKWLKKVNLFTYDLVFIPIKDDDHWALVVVDIKEKKIKYLDSLFTRNPISPEIIKQFLKQYAQDADIQPNPENWVIQIIEDIPGQANYSDCGVFVCQYVEFLSRNATINFTQPDIQALRKRMAYEILNHQLLDL